MSLGIDVDRGAADTAGWAVHAWGSPDDQPIVLLHGFMQTGDSWSTMVQNLARCYYVVAPTMVARSAEDATLAAMAMGAYGAAQQAMLHTGRRSVVLVGYSQGGRIALEFVRRYSRAVKALVLESAGLGPENETDRAAYAQRNADLAERFEAAASMDDVVKYWEKLPVFASQAELSQAKLDVQHDCRMSCNRQQQAWMLQHAGVETMPLADETRRMLQDLPMPVLYVAGSRDAKYAKIAQSLQGGHVETKLLDCGHNLHLEEPDAFTDAVMDFLDRNVEA